MDLNIKDFDYTVLDTNSCLDTSFKKLYLEVYGFWKETWKGIFTKVGSPEAWVADDFSRQHYIPVITYKGELVATHYYTVFDLRDPSVVDMRYFSIFPENAKNFVFGGELNKVMSMEFLSVHREWRKKALGFSAAEALISLGFNLLREKNIDAALGVAVKTAGVDKMAEKLSCSVLAENIKRGELVCDLFAREKSNIARHPDREVQDIIDYLWNNRIYSNEKEVKKKIA